MKGRLNNKKSKNKKSKNKKTNKKSKKQTSRRKEDEVREDEVSEDEVSEDEDVEKDFVYESLKDVLSPIDNPYNTNIYREDEIDRWRYIIDYLENRNYITKKNNNYVINLIPIDVLHRLAKVVNGLIVSRFYYLNDVHDSYVIWFDTNLYNLNYNYIIIGNNHPFALSETEGIIQCNENGCFKDLTKCREVCNDEINIRKGKYRDIGLFKIQQGKRLEKINMFIDPNERDKKIFRMIREFLQIRKFRELEKTVDEITEQMAKCKDINTFKTLKGFRYDMVDSAFKYAEPIAELITGYKD